MFRALFVASWQIFLLLCCILSQSINPYLNLPLNCHQNKSSPCSFTLSRAMADRPALSKEGLFLCFLLVDISLLQGLGPERAVPGHTLPLAPVVGTTQAPPGCSQGIGYLPYLSTPAESLIWNPVCQSCFHFLLLSIRVVCLSYSFIFSFLHVYLLEISLVRSMQVDTFAFSLSVQVAELASFPDSSVAGICEQQGLTAFPGAVMGLSEVACGSLSFVFLCYLHRSQLVQLISPWPQSLYCLSPSIKG